MYSGYLQDEGGDEESQQWHVPANGNKPSVGHREVEELRMVECLQ